MSGEVIFSINVNTNQSNTSYGSSWGPLGWADIDGLKLAPGLLESFTNEEIAFDETLIFPVTVDDQRFENNIATFAFDGEVRETIDIDDWRPLKFLFKNDLTISANDAEVNFPYLRYADVLLLQAEAENEITPSAYELVNLVRRRAFNNQQNDLPLNLNRNNFLRQFFRRGNWNFVSKAFERMTWYDDNC